MRVGLLISGTGSNMVALVEDMAKPDHLATAAVVLSDKPDAPGLSRAEALGVPAVAVDRAAFPKDRAGFEAAMTRVLQEHAVDLICLAGFMRLLSAAFVDEWAGRMLNIHPSLLPRHKGLDTHARALAAGDAEHGCTVHEVTFEMDEGPILGQAKLTVAPDDTPDSLAKRVLELEHQLYPAVLRRVTQGERSRLDLA